MSSLSRVALRKFSTTSVLRAAAAAAPAPAAAAAPTATPRSYTRTPVSRVAKPTTTSTTPKRTYTRKPVTPAAAAAPVDIPAPAPAAEAPEDVFDDFPMPPSDIPDYAALTPSRSSYPTRAPAPLAGVSATTTFPGETPAPAPTLPSSLPAAAPVSAVVGDQADWSSSFHGLSVTPFSKEVAERLMRPLNEKDVELKPDGLLYLPEIKYRRTLNESFGPGGWGLAPRGETSVGPRVVSREWGLVCLGRLVAVARGEQEYFDPSGLATAMEAAKSNALMRCCKDLGVASELWDPTFIKAFKKEHCKECFVEHATTKKRRKLWRKKTASFDYPYKEVSN